MILTRETVGFAAVVPLRSNEMFSVHFSMYGVLAMNVPHTYGSSLWSLILSVIPRVIWPGRPADIYEHYATGVDAVAGQGYGIHHATGWYLNFGLPGVIVGAVVLGCVWAGSFNRLVTGTGESHGIVSRLVAAIVPWTIVGNMPAFVRAGPEAYKGLVLESLVFPVCVLALACVRFRFIPGAKGVSVATFTSHRKNPLRSLGVGGKAIEGHSPGVGVDGC